MATHIFSAERQLIFYVAVEGRRVLVQFEERNQFGASNFTTQDEKVAAAIRKHSMFERGIISENTPPQVKEKKKKRGRATDSTEGEMGLMGSMGQMGDDAGVSQNSQDEQPTPTLPDESDENVIEVENFTQAKEAVMKRLGVSNDEVKNPILLGKVCKENGLKIKYTKQ